MSYLHAEIYKQGLNYLDVNGTRLDICSTEPTTYAQATSTYTCGCAIINSGSPTAGDPNGWMCVIPAVSGGYVTVTATAAYWAITNGSSLLLAATALSGSQAVTSGNTFNLTSFNVRIPAPA